MDINEMSIEELEKEVERRKAQDKRSLRPEAKSYINYDRLIEFCEDYFNDLENDQNNQEDVEQFSYEVLLETLYGNEVWDYINSF